ncbi:RNA-directed DNA polymerase [Guptibacillus spartinae]|uniref:RNA-directed DNA polymerase n=1 Tax=Guptibacillus spartinae TaxID=3025679 RepID=UPI00236099FD|nr:RNA-directed DNA polymerase [Pseudalkalibacillus spartinae]
MSLIKSIQKYELGKYFLLDYFLKYGYFDFKYASKDANENYMVSNLVYKKVMNTDGLAKEFREIKKKVSFKSREDTVPIEFSIYKNENERRNFKIPNLYSYICLCIHLSENKEEYINILSSSEKSLTNEFYSSSFLKRKIIREENRIGKKHIFKTDIQNFYPTIYTHSIPWILVGKSVAKSTKKNKNKYYNQLDSLIQRCQRGETHGLPTGSFASRLIAEIYMCKFDEKMVDYSYVRYVDDFEFSYNDESEKNEFYKDLTKELNSLNLKIKVEKNSLDTFPFQGDNDSTFFFSYFLKLPKEIKVQSRTIHSFIDSCIYKEREGFKGSLKLMFQALKSSIEKEEILQAALTKPLLKKLFNMVLMSPHLSVYYLEFVDVITQSIIDNRLKKGIEEIKTQILVNINRYIDLNYNQELYSILSIFKLLNIYSVCDKETLLLIIKKMDDLSSVLSFELLMNEKNFDDHFFEMIEEKLKISTSWHEEYWFFKYHVLLRINENKKSKIHKDFKNFLYKKYDNGVEKSKFFNLKNIKKIESPINVAWQNTNSDQDIAMFFKTLLDKKISFIHGN